jgi:hypothetical protein
MTCFFDHRLAVFALTFAVAGCGGKPAASGAPEAEPEPDGGLCNAAGWCWAEPTPFGDMISAIHGTPDGAVVYAVGAGGVILEFRAGDWHYHHGVTQDELDQVLVVDQNDVWVGGAKGLWHYDGALWTPSHSGRVAAIERTTAGQTWAILDYRVHRRAGTEWVDVSPSEGAYYGDLAVAKTAARGVRCGDPRVWTVAPDRISKEYHARIYEFDGSTWRVVEGVESPSFFNTPELLWFDGAVYAYERDLWRVSDASWASLNFPNGVSAAWPAPDGVLFVAESIGGGFSRFERSGSISLLAKDSPRAIWGTSAQDLWLGLRDGGVVRFDGSGAPPAQVSNLRPPSPPNSATWGTVPPTVWANAPAAWGSGPNDVWRTPLEHFDGNAWTKLGEAYAVDIDGSAPDNVWFALNETTWADGRAPHMLLWDGVMLHTMALPADWNGYQIEAVRSFGPDDTWVGAHGPEHARIGRYDGQTWSTLLDFGVQLAGVYWGAIEGEPSRALWFAGREGILYFDGTRFSQPVGRDPDEYFQSLAVDDYAVWILGSKYIQALDGSRCFSRERYLSDPLSEIDLTESHVWIRSSDGRAVKRPR